MDTSYEDKMYRQIERSLSNNINDKLYVPIEMMNKSTYKGSSREISNQALDEYSEVTSKPINELKGNVNNALGEYKDEGPRLSRAEYIHQAREACLRQMNSNETAGRIYDNYGQMDDDLYFSRGRKNKDKVEKLYNGDKEDVPEELASFRFLIIRTVCAAVIFISIFIIDKVKVSWGGFTYEALRQYVTGNNQLKALEEIIVSWLK